MQARLWSAACNIQSNKSQNPHWSQRVPPIQDQTFLDSALELEIRIEAIHASGLSNLLRFHPEVVKKE